MWILRSDAPGRDADEDPIAFRMQTGATKTIGRALGADFIVDAGLVSRVHCRLEAGDASVNVTDLDSTNGTYVNDQRITIGTLVDGDRLRVGRVELRVERAHADVSAAQPAGTTA